MNTMPASPRSPSGKKEEKKEAPRSLSDLPTTADAIPPQKGNENTYRAAELRDLHYKAPTSVRRKLVVVGFNAITSSQR